MTLIPFVDEKQYNCEKAIKKVAKGIVYVAVVFAILAALATLVLLLVCAVEDSDLLWIPAVVLGGGALIFFGLILLSHFVWGYGDLIGNAKRCAKAATTPVATQGKTAPTAAPISAIPAIEKLPDL